MRNKANFLFLYLKVTNTCRKYSTSGFRKSTFCGVYTRVLFILSFSLIWYTHLLIDVPRHAWIGLN